MQITTNGPADGSGGSQLERLLRRRDADPPELRDRLGAILEAGAEHQLELLAGLARRRPGTTAQNPLIEAPGRCIRGERLEHVPTRHALRARLDDLAVQDQLELADRGAAGHAPAAREQRAAAPGRDRAREREVEQRQATQLLIQRRRHPTQPSIRSGPAKDCPRAPHRRQLFGGARRRGAHPPRRGRRAARAARARAAGGPARGGGEGTRPGGLRAARAQPRAAREAPATGWRRRSGWRGTRRSCVR